MAKDQLTMKDKRDEEEKLEKHKKKKDSKALSWKAKGNEKEGKDSSKKIVKSGYTLSCPTRQEEGIGPDMFGRGQP